MQRDDEQEVERNRTRANHARASQRPARLRPRRHGLDRPLRLRRRLAALAAVGTPSEIPPAPLSAESLHLPFSVAAAAAPRHSSPLTVSVSAPQPPSSPPPTPVPRLSIPSHA